MNLIALDTSVLLLMLNPAPKREPDKSRYPDVQAFMALGGKSLIFGLPAPALAEALVRQPRRQEMASTLGPPAFEYLEFNRGAAVTSAGFINKSIARRKGAKSCPRCGGPTCRVCLKIDALIAACAAEHKGVAAFCTYNVAEFRRMFADAGVAMAVVEPDHYLPAKALLVTHPPPKPSKKRKGSKVMSPPKTP